MVFWLRLIIALRACFRNVNVEFDIRTARWLELGQNSLQSFGIIRTIDWEQSSELVRLRILSKFWLDSQWSGFMKDLWVGSQSCFFCCNLSHNSSVVSECHNNSNNFTISALLDIRRQHVVLRRHSRRPAHRGVPHEQAVHGRDLTRQG